MSTKNWLRFWAAGLIWSTSFLWIKIALQEVGPLMLVAFRTFFATVGSLIIILLNRKRIFMWSEIKQWLPLFLLLGLTNVAIPFGLISWGEKYIPSGIASVLNSTTPLFTLLLAIFFLKDDRVSISKWVGLLVGFTGVIMLFLPELREKRVENILGLVAVMTGACGYALSGIIIKRKVKGLNAEFQVLLQYAFAFFIMLPMTLLFEKPISLPHQALSWIALVWLGLLGSSLASFFYFKLIHSIGPTRASTVTYVPPLVGLLLGAIILGEPMGWLTLIGGSLIVCGIMLINRQDSPLKEPIKT